MQRSRQARLETKVKPRCSRNDSIKDEQVMTCNLVMHSDLFFHNVLDPLSDSRSSIAAFQWLSLSFLLRSCKSKREASSRLLHCHGTLNEENECGGILTRLNGLVDDWLALFYVHRLCFVGFEWEVHQWCKVFKVSIIFTNFKCFFIKTKQQFIKNVREVVTHSRPPFATSRNSTAWTQLCSFLIIENV